MTQVHAAYHRAPLCARACISHDAVRFVSAGGGGTFPAQCCVVLVGGFSGLRSINSD